MKRSKKNEAKSEEESSADEAFSHRRSKRAALQDK
jgi:hypothetical protein